MRADVEVLVIGAGHAGLSVAWQLRRLGRALLLVDANPRVGDAWRMRWDSLVLFTPRELNALPGLRFPRGPTPFPGKDEVAEYQERYAAEMKLPLRLGARVRTLRHRDGCFAAEVDGDRITSRAVVVATGAFQAPRVPPFAGALDDTVVQLHSSAYRNPALLPEGPVVVVGAANSGAEIAVEVAARRPTTLATGTPLRRAPARFFDPRWWRIAYLRGLIIGDRDLPKFVPWPLRRSSFTKVDLSRAANEHGLRFAARAVSAARNTICFADGTAVTARAVIWATGFAVDHSWIDAPRRDGIIAISRHRRGSLPGLWFVHSRFLFPINHQAYGVAHDVARWLRHT